MKTKCEEINSKLLAACKRAFDFVDDEFNNKTVVEMNGSFGLWLDLKQAIEFAENISKDFFTSDRS